MKIVFTTFILILTFLLGGCDCVRNPAPVQTAVATNGWTYKPTYYNPQGIDCFCKPEKAKHQSKLIAPKNTNWNRM